jgi:hypothetical protein
VPPPLSSTSPGPAWRLVFWSVASLAQIRHATGSERWSGRTVGCGAPLPQCRRGVDGRTVPVFAMAELAHEPKRNGRKYLARWLGMLRADAKPLMVATGKASAGTA